MTLKEKFDKVMVYPFSEYREQMKVIKEENSKECEKVAEEFAIGFAEWAIAKNMGVNKFTLYEGELEIYKKEKGL